MPWTEPSLPQAVVRGPISIMELTGSTQPILLFTYASSASRDPDTPALSVSLRPDTNPAELCQGLAQHAMPEQADRAGSGSRLRNARAGV